MQKKKILILGLGNLGKVLFRLWEKEAQVCASYRNKEKVLDFPSEQLIFYDLLSDPPEDFRKDWDLVVCCYTPVSNLITCLDQWKNFFDANTAFVFVSSTSVFGDGKINENSSRDGKSRNSELLVEAEDLIKRQWKNYLIVRPSGLVDEKRRPENFFKKSLLVQKSLDFVNLVRTEDVAFFIHHCVSMNLFGEEFNLASDLNQTKEEFYGALNIPSLQFSREGSTGRKISNEKSKAVGFYYRYPYL